MIMKKKIIYHSDGKQYTKSLKKQKKKCIENKSKVVKKKKNYKKWLVINPRDYGEGKNKKRE